MAGQAFRLAVALASVLSAVDAVVFLEAIQKSAMEKVSSMTATFKSNAKGSVCRAMPGPLKAFCGGEAGSAPLCSGEDCCLASSCHSSFLPGMKCDSSRGATTCVGGGLFATGVCQCRTGSCDSAGRCSISQDSAYAELFQDGEPVPREDFTVARVVLVGLVFSGALGALTMVRRAFQWVRGTPPADPVWPGDEVLLE